MPRDNYGQLITFAAERDPDLNASRFVYVRAQQGDTIFKIAARRGHPELAAKILALNSDVVIKLGVVGTSFPIKLRSMTQFIPSGTLIKLPGTLAPGESFNVLCGENRPKIVNGYAKYSTVDRPGRVGINRFDGYDPIEMDIAIRFESFTEADGVEVERKIAILERMAGRGAFDGAAQGPPAVIRVSVTDNKHNVVPLIPSNYQWSRKNPTAPLYRISNIAWDDGALGAPATDKLPGGGRIRATAVVTVKQFTPGTNVKRTMTQRAKSKGS